MSDALGNPGEPVAEVDPDDLRTFWQEMQEMRKLQSRHPDQHVSIVFEAKGISKPAVNGYAVWYLKHDLGAQPIRAGAVGSLDQR